MKAIRLTNGENLTIVDDEDFDFLRRFRWDYIPKGNNEYVRTHSLGGVYMHDLLLMPIPPLIVMHLDDVGLHNFRSNLKIGTHSENHHRAFYTPTGSGLPRGVVRRAYNRYRARIMINNETVSLGTFSTPEEASAVYERKRKELCGDE